MKLAIITGSRADWGLLEPLVYQIYNSNGNYRLQLVVTGSHLSHEFGYTIKDITYPVNEQIECVLSSDTPVGICKSIGLAVSSFGECFERLKPDTVIVLGDRWDVMASAIASHVSNIPIIHIHGGEVTEGSYDNAWRFAITHMAQLHFPATDKYASRIIQTGQWPNTVYNVGALGCDGLEKRKDYTDNNFFIFCVYPQTLDIRSDEVYPLLKACRPGKSKILLIGGSHDVGFLCFDKACKDNGIFSYQRSMPREHFLYFLKDVDAIVGNSSCGIIEAPALGVPTINIGNRQKGRLMADSIIQAEPTKESIKAAFDKLYSEEFQALMKTDYYTPYQGGNVAEKIWTIIKRKMPLNVKKSFFDVHLSNTDKEFMMKCT